MRTLNAIPLGLLLASAGAGAAMAGEEPLERATEWSWDWWVLVSLALAALWYGAGIVRLYRRLGAARVVGRLESVSFALGLGTIFMALESPIDTISDQLFCVHMVQHLLLMLVAAPLLVFGRPVIAFLWAFPARARRRVGRLWTGLDLNRCVRAMMHPVAVWLIFFAVFIAWHLPGPYQDALGNDAIHTGMHLSFLIAALMFWSIVIEPSGRRLGYGATFLFVASTGVISAMPGALLALAQRPLYPAYAGGAAAWGITQLEDQQLAGVVMWIPGGFVYVLAAAIVFVKWLQEAEHRTLPPVSLRPARFAALAVVAAALLPLVGCGDSDPPNAVAGLGNASNGPTVMRAFGCGACHVIPGVADANGLVGPPLIHFRNRVYIAGLLHNDPDNLTLWLRHPQRIVPGNVMPDMGLQERDARDIAAYLYTLQ